MNQDHTRRTALIAIVVLLFVCTILAVSGQTPNWGANPMPNSPWLDKSLSPDKRADLLLQQMTLDEKLVLVHQDPGPLARAHSLGGAGFVAGIPRLGIPDIQMTDGRSGIAHMGSHGRYTTALPSPLADAATWDPNVAYEFGALIGKEARDLGFQVSLGGTANLIREPRNGRNYECLGEDPILVGKMLGRELKGTQDQGVIGNINRFAVNDQETGRMVGSAVIDRRAMLETDLLAFEVAIKESDVGTVMCAYNRVNTVYACENSYLLTDVLKRSWDYKGWVMTDWGALHSTVPSALAGLDQEMGEATYFAGPLREAVKSGEVPTARVDEMVHRILRTEFALGVFDNPPVPRPVNPFTGAEVAQHVEEQGIVLLKNVNGQLPLEASALKSIVVIGSHADVGVLSGKGSDQVDAAGGNAVPEDGEVVWHPSSPLKAIRAKAPNAEVEYNPGTDFAAAATLAAASDVAIVFVHQHTSEGSDVGNLSLPDNQDQLLSQVAAANPRTIVVLETSGPVTMPWVDKVPAILEAWYPGIRGGEAIANIIFGDVNPSGKLPVTFPKSEADLPHLTVPGMPLESARAGGEVIDRWEEGTKPLPPFDINYTEGMKVGYKWFEAEGKEPLFPFGFGLSYTTFRYSGLDATWGSELNVSFRVTNNGQRAGAETAQVYVLLPPASGEPFKRLVGWEKIQLAQGETKAVPLKVNRHYLSIFNASKQEWELVPGEYTVCVGGSSRSTPLTEVVHR
jgi:beta-glucosidase